jgi:hypothetical protein
MEITGDNPYSRRLISRKWWESRRRSYNKGLVIAGVSAFFTYILVGPFVLLALGIPFEIGIDSIFLQAIAYVTMMGVANVFYYLGPLADRLFNKASDDRFRQRLFRLGCWFSCALPFLVPALFIAIYLARR